jgi:hypothetical protein
MFNRAPWYFVEDEVLVCAVWHLPKAQADVELWSASHHNPQQYRANVFRLSEQLEDGSNVCFSLTFVQRVDHDNTRQGPRASLLYPQEWLQDQLLELVF